MSTERHSVTAEPWEQRDWCAITPYLFIDGISCGGGTCLALSIRGPRWLDQVMILDGRPIWFFFNPTMENYEYIVGRGKFDRYLSNSVIVSVVSTFLTLMLGGYVLMHWPELNSVGGSLLPTQHQHGHGMARTIYGSGLRLSVSSRRTHRAHFQDHTKTEMAR